MLSIAHRIDNNNNDIMSLSTSLIDLFDTVDNSVPTFELQKRIIQASNIVEMIALDNDLSGSGKCKGENLKEMEIYKIIFLV
jgi:hypothetical protein